MGSPFKALATPAVLRLMGIALLSRTIIAALPIVLLLCMAGPYGYGIAAVVNGTYVMVNAILGPLRGRVVDRFGQWRAFTVMGLTAVTFMVLVAVSVDNVWPWWTSLALVLGAGLTTPPFNAALRTSWRRVVADQDALRVAHSTDSIVEEVCFVLGPATAGMLVVLLEPKRAYGIAVAAYALTTLSYVYTARRYGLGGEKAAPAGTGRRRLGALGERTMYRIMLPLIVMGSLLGGVSIYVPAVTQARDQLIWLGPLLAMISVGGVIGGVLYGLVPREEGLWRKYRTLGLGLVAPACLLVAADPLWTFGALLVLSGLFVTPLFISAYLLVDKEIDRHVKHEANIWVGSSANIANGITAMAVGSLVAGQNWLAARALLSAVAAGGVAVFLSWIRKTRVTTESQASHEADLPLTAMSLLASSPPQAVRVGADVAGHDLGAAESAAAAFLTALGVRLDHEALAATPSRMARAYAEMLTPREFDLTTFPNSEGYEELVVQRNVPFASVCEHHALPFIGTADVGYLPGSRIIGLSKLARVVELFACRPQVQERMTMQIAAWLTEHLQPRGVGVVVRAEHMCMRLRGVQVTGTQTVTSALQGLVREDGRTRQEFMALTSNG